MSSGLCTLAIFIEARLHTTVSHGIYFILICQFSSVSSINFDGEVFWAISVQSCVE
jgi:hypothetical protein